MRDNTFTPGPWRWEINRKHKTINLTGGLPAGTFDKTVLGFERYGMSGAAPVFHNWTENGWGGAPKKAHELAVEKKGREHHSDWFALIDHPNARLIAAAPDMYDALWEAVELSDRTVTEAGRTPECQRVYDIVRAALKKAEGE